MFTKTIFISVFEGVEAKNLLRTDVIPTLLSEPNARLVFLMKNAERVEKYKKEFRDPRIVYEVASYSRRLGRGLDRLLGFLKFALLRTDTKKLQRKLAFLDNKNFIAYAAKEAVNFLIARPIVRRAARFLDFKLVQNDLYKALFDKYNPDLVFLAHLFEEPEIHILREAKHRGIKTVGFVNSWDKVTAKCIMRLLPDKVVVFNDIVKKEMMDHNEMREKDIFVAGIPQYDHYFGGHAIPRDEFFKKIGVDLKNKLLIYTPAGRAFSDSDWDAIDMLSSLAMEGKFGKEVEFFVRFQPNDGVEEYELKKRPHLKYDYPGMRFSDKRGVDWDMDKKDLEHLRDTLTHMALTVSYASSFVVDAAVFDKPIVNLGFELREPALSKRAVRHFYKVAHYQNVLKTGGTKVVGSERELIDAVKKYLENPGLDGEKRKKIVETQCKFTDGKSGERIGKFILQML